MKTRAELDTMLDRLAQALPGMLAEHPDDADFWPAFAGEADEITENTTAADCEHVRGRLDRILADADLLAGEGSA